MSDNKSKYFEVNLTKIVQADSQRDAVAFASGKRVSGARVLTDWTEAGRISATDAHALLEE